MIWSAMRALESRASRRRFMWLLWLALLTPIAQTVATAHALSHSQLEATGDSGGNQIHHGALCGLCVTAATLSSAASTGAPPFVPSLGLSHKAPHADSILVALTLTARAYESRAPPLFPH